MKEDKKEEKIGEALLKVALGYQLAEVTEEYAEVDGALKLTKRKKTKKDVPPDLKAVQMLLEKGGEGADVASLTDEELEKEKARLIGILQSAVAAQQGVAGQGKGQDVSKTKAKKGGGADLDGVDSGALGAERKTVKKTVRRSVVKRSVVKKKTK
ncbi:MAG: hypothetical protein J6C79_00145 [Clostridia bacterium]|nr:hypothetical protein [Clostridia bacterium]